MSDPNCHFLKDYKSRSLFWGEVLCWWSKHAIQADGTNLRQSRSRDHHDGLLWDHIPITITNPQQPNPSFKMFSNDIYIINVHILVIFWGVKKLNYWSNFRVLLPKERIFLWSTVRLGFGKSLISSLLSILFCTKAVLAGWFVRKTHHIGVFRLRLTWVRLIACDGSTVLVEKNSSASKHRCLPWSKSIKHKSHTMIFQGEEEGEKQCSSNVFPISVLADFGLGVFEKLVKFQFHCQILL